MTDIEHRVNLLVTALFSSIAFVNPSSSLSIHSQLDA